MNNKQRTPRRGPGVPVEKAKNFKEAIKRLLKELKSFKVFIIISLILACFSAILSISAPNRLSKLTDEISKGLVINTKSLEKVTKEITTNMTNTLPKVLRMNVSPSIMMDQSISLEDKNKLSDALDEINIEDYTNKLGIDKYTLEDIIKSLKQPLRDPRDNFEKPLLKSDILKIEDLKIGMKLQGTVRNVVDFGVFIDIGLKNDGLAHISKLTTNYIKHPMEVVNVGDIVDCYVDDIFSEKNKVALSLLDPTKNIKN